MIQSNSTLFLFPDDLDPKHQNEHISPKSFKKEAYPLICRSEVVIYHDLIGQKTYVLKIRYGETGIITSLRK